MISILIFIFYIINQICFIILYQIRLVFLIFEIKYCLTEVLEHPGAELPRLMSWRYATNVTQTSVNKERYWLTPTLLHITKGANVRHSHVVYLKFFRRHVEICDRVTISFARILLSTNKRNMFCCHLSLHH